MPSILERLRRRTLSHRSPAQVAQVPRPAAPSSNLLLPTSRSEPSLLDRRIVEDLPALLGQLTEPPAQEEGALKPPRARKRSGLANLGFIRKDDISESGATRIPEREGPSIASQGKEKERATGSERNTETTSSPWSTFGRHHKRRMKTSPYRQYSSSRRGSHIGPAAFHASSSSNAMGDHTSSNMTSRSFIDGAQSNVSHTSVGMISSESWPHTFGMGGRRPPDAGDRSPASIHSPISNMTPDHSPDDIPSFSSPSPMSHVAEALPAPPTNDDNLVRWPAVENYGSATPEAGMLRDSSISAHPVDPAYLQVQDIQPPLETTVGTVSAGGPSRGEQDGRLLPSAAAEPHAQHASSEGTSEPCSPSRIIPSPLPFPASPTLLDATALPITYRVLPTPISASAKAISGWQNHGMRPTR
ncbi:hypothetical protein C8Q77DRAFT_280599 [Trametes polyzona]|nr:hypothetical protein C8Q77DRAFT_280599 [Trametes polyzona]